MAKKKKSRKVKPLRPRTKKAIKKIEAGLKMIKKKK